LNDIVTFDRTVTWSAGAMGRELRSDGRSTDAHRSTVSVVVPTYNDRDRLTACLRSLQQQSYPRERTQLIVVDDGSHDDTVAEVRRQFPEVVVVAKGHTGSDDSRNAGVDACSGDLIAFTDSDCVPHPTWLERMVRRLEAVPGGAVGGRVVHRGGFLERLTGVADFGEFQGLREREVASLPTCNLGVRARVFDRCHFDTRMSANGDTLFSARLREVGTRLLFAPEVAVEHRPATSLRTLFRRAERYGASFVEARLLEPSLPWSTLVRGGLVGVVGATLGRAALDIGRLIRHRRPAGFRLVELPAAAALLALRRLVSVPAAVRAYRAVRRARPRSRPVEP
jgi:cellulose synthase/poly-beta-1,6-N-acetylglucosamine synthase-like glycosyltransferase